MLTSVASIYREAGSPRTGLGQELAGKLWMRKTQACEDGEKEAPINRGRCCFKTS